MNHRWTISLNGQWDFVADLDPKYHLDPHDYPVPAYSRPEANRRHWQEVRVPGVWQRYGSKYEIFEGVCWFAREFDVATLPPGSAARLRFGAVNYLCRVFLNGEEIGSHEGGYTAFVLDATGRLRAGRNHIAILVDNRAVTTKWPPCLGYFNYGGIHRDVTLEIHTAGCLSDVRVAAVPTEKGGALTVTGGVMRPPRGTEIRVSCGEATATVRPSVEGRFQCDTHVPDVETWSPDCPTLYPVSVVVEKEGERIDSKEIPCGFRSVERSEGQIRLNGKAVQLQGVCYIYDSTEYGLVMTTGQIERDLDLVKTMGCNAVRTQYPMDSRFYEACDRKGLLVWAEPNIYYLHPRNDSCGTAFADPDYRRTAERMCRELVAMTRNHPSVVLYSLGNECNTGHPEAEAFFRRTAEIFRSEDSSRLLSYAALYGAVGPVAELVDVLGINSYWGWYDKVFGGKGERPEADAGAPGEEKEPIDLAAMRGMLDGVLQEHPDLPLILTEFGADAVPGQHSPTRSLWSEEYQADLLREVLRLAGDYPRIVGTFPFCFSDYGDPSKVFNGYWDGLNYKGVVGYDRTKKMGYDAVRECYMR